MSKMFKPYRLFVYTKSEFRGLLVLVFILVSVLIVKMLLVKQPEPAEIVVSPIEREVENIENATVDKGYVSPSRPSVNLIKGVKYNPNVADKDQLLSLGFSPVAVSNLIKYRDKGGKFHSLTDLQKIYGMDSTYLGSIAHFLTFPESVKRENDIYNTGKSAEYSVIELNRADTMALVSLPGIGEVLAKRICKYRNLLGGFYSSNQLSEVYGISDSLQQILSEIVIIDTLAIKKINLNQSTFQQLTKHPYLTNYEAKAILSYRRISGDFISTNQLISNYLLSEKKYLRLLPYIEVY